MGESINIIEYLDIFKKRKKVVFIILFIFMLVGGGLQYKNSKSYIPTYSSTVSVRINSNKNVVTQQPQPQEGEDNPENQQDVEQQNNQQTYQGSSIESSALNQSIGEKYSSLATSKRAMTELIAKLGLEGTPEKVSKYITVTPQANLMEFIDITVTNTNRELAQKIANAMPEVFNNEIIKVIGLDCVEVLYDASEPTIIPKAKDNTFIKFTLIGVVLAIFMVLLLECIDNKIVTPEDAEKYWELPVIGIVPLERENAKGKKVKIDEAKA